MTTSGYNPTAMPGPETRYIPRIPDFTPRSNRSAWSPMAPRRKATRRNPRLSHRGVAHAAAQRPPRGGAARPRPLFV